MSRLAWAAVGLHATQAVVMLALTVWIDSSRPSNAFNIYKTVHIWHSAHDITTVVDNVGTFDGRWAIVAFFAMSAAFPAAIMLLDVDPRFRFAEYAFSASTMIMVIALQVGINDIYTLQAMFVLTFATMVFGILESWLAHVVGWITFLSAYSPILDAFALSTAQSPVSAPDFVPVIVVLEFILFGCFGCVQTYDLWSNNAYDVEPVYVILSLVAKTLLGWLVFSPLLMA